MSFTDTVVPEGIGNLVRAVSDVSDTFKMSDTEAMRAAIQLAELDSQLLKESIKDTQDARLAQGKALTSDDVFIRRHIYYFSAVWSFFAIVYFFAVTFISLPASGVRFADTVLGVLISTVVGQIISYYFGSSARSAHKDEVIKSLTAPSRGQ